MPALRRPRPALPRFAVAWFPAFAGIERIEAFRRRHDPACALIAAHLSLVFPFPTAHSRLQVVTHVRRVVSRWPRIPVTFRRVRMHANEFLFLMAARGAASVTALHDKLVTRFYKGDTQAYWRFGETSAEWALQHQLRGLFSVGEARRFLGFAPQIYKNYFDGGELVIEQAPTHVDLVIRGVSRPHVYFEYSIIGFAYGGIRALQVDVKPECLQGFSKGDAEVRYRFAVTK